jgi:hypothetical protein
MTSLNISNCTALDTLKINGNDLTSLNASNCTSLKKLDCEGNSLTSLNVTGCNALTELELGSNNFKSFTLSGLPNLEWLRVCDNGLTSISLSDLPKLTYLNVEGNDLTSLNLTVTSLKELQCNNNSLTTLDVRNLTSLEGLYCSGNKLTLLDVRGMASLKYLNCYHNRLTALDLTGCTALQWLDCSKNELTSLNIAGTAIASNINCYHNLMNSTADVTGYTGGSFDLQRQKVDITGKDVSAIQAEIDGIIVAGKVPYVVGTKTNAAGTLTINIPSDKEVHWNATYKGGALKLVGQGSFNIERDGSLTVTNVDADWNNIWIKGTLTVNGDIKGTGDGCRIDVRVRGELFVKGNVIFEGSGAQLYNNNGKITVNGNVTGNNLASGQYLVNASGTVTIGGNVETSGIAVCAWGKGNITVNGNVTAKGDYAIRGNNKGVLIVKGNVTSDKDGIKMDKRSVVKINGTLTVGTGSKYINNEKLEDLTGTNKNGYANVYDAPNDTTDRWSVSVGKTSEKGMNTMLIVGIVAVAAIAAIAAYFFVIRPRMK